MAKIIPEIPIWKMVKNARNFVKNPIPILSSFIEENGDTFAMRVGGYRKAIFTINPKIAQYVLQKNNRNYRKSEIQTKVLRQYAGYGLLTSDGAYWLRQRRLIQPGFHRAKLAALTQTMLRVVLDARKDFDELAASGKVFDLSDKMTEMAFDIVARSLFTTSVGYEELNFLADNIQNIQEYIVRRLRQPYLTWWFRLSGEHKKQYQRSKDAQKTILNIIQERRASGERHDDLLDMLLDARYEDTNEGMTDQQLLDEAIILFVAGHETTANALAWTFYLLSQHPEAVEKIKKEYETVIGDRPIDFSDFRKLTYTKQVINESMRLFPPAWVTDRLANEDDKVEDFTIQKGRMVAVYIYGLHRSEQLWKNPNAFVPERFHKENMKTKPAFAYMPFGGGPRLCIGNNFAMMEMQLVVLEMINRYEFTLIKNQKIEAMPYVTLQPKYGIKMKVAKKS
ncbi:MAG: cytochrome P450 [Bacteroidota bacterium]